jgi:hypothetical protein
MFGKSKQPSYSADSGSVEGSNAIPNAGQVPVSTGQEPITNPVDSTNASPTAPLIQPDTPIKEYAQPNVPQQAPYQEEIVVNTPFITVRDVAGFNQHVSVAFGIFLVSLLSLDVWYSRRKSILKPTGHTLAHIMFLTILVLSILFLIRPGVIL